MLATSSLADDAAFTLVSGSAGRKVDATEMGKVFVGGLSRETTTDGLRLYFERFGEICDCVVMKDRSTGAPRGFGFVTYTSQTVADRVVHHRHVIDGKEVEAKPAVPRESETLATQRSVLPPPLQPGMGRTMPGFAPPNLASQNGGAQGTTPSFGGGQGSFGAPPQRTGAPPNGGGGGLLGGSGGGRGGGRGSGAMHGSSQFGGSGGGANAEFPTNKIFVGGLSHDTSENDFVGYFSLFGPVIDCVIMCDPHTRKPRGFGFITFDNTAAVDRACVNKFHELNGKFVEVKRAIPQERMNEAEGVGDGMSLSGFAVGKGSGGRGRGGPMGGFPSGGGVPMGASPVGAAFSNGGRGGGLRAVDYSQSGLDAALSTANSVLASLAEPPQDVPHRSETQVPSSLLSAFSNPSNFSSATESLRSGSRAGYGAIEQAFAGADDPSTQRPSVAAAVGGAAQHGVLSGVAQEQMSALQADQQRQLDQYQMQQQLQQQQQQQQQQQEIFQFQQQLLKQHKQSQAQLMQLQHQHEQQALLQQQAQQLQILQQAQLQQQQLMQRNLLEGQGDGDDTLSAADATMQRLSSLGIDDGLPLPASAASSLQSTTLPSASLPVALPAAQLPGAQLPGAQLPINSLPSSGALLPGFFH